MLVEKHINGIIEICEAVDDYLFTRRYIGYTKRQAVQKFKQEIKTQK